MSDAEQDSKAPNLGQYFNQDVKNTCNIFDQLSSSNSSAMMSSIVESPSTQDLFSTARESISLPATSTTAKEESGEEPVICKIFSQEETRTSRKAASFFDAISSSKDYYMEPKIKSPDVSCDFENEGPFPSPLRGFEDFSDILNCAESDRARESWIPTEATRSALIQMAMSQPGTYSPPKEMLTLPGVVLEEEMVDNVTSLLKHHFSETEANQRKVLTMTDVSQDERGLRELIQSECYRAAVNLTGKLLEPYGQGQKRQGSPSKHTVHSIQIWFTRLSLLVKLGAYQIAEREAAPWGAMDGPDLFYQFYPELYGGKPGTMVPFQMRVLLATLPAYTEKIPVALERLFGVLATVQQIIVNLESGKGEDGSFLQLSDKETDIAKQVWQSREARVLHSIVNVALMAKEYNLAIEVLQTLIKKNKSRNQRRSLYSALGRVFLQVGDLPNAEKCFSLSSQLKRVETGTLSSNKSDLRELIDKGLVALSRNSFPEALECFNKASVLNPSNILVLNNKAVCLLYMGQLKNAINILTSAIQSNPSVALNEALLLNLCTLFELESSYSERNKKVLLRQIAKYRGDAVNVACLKLTT